MLSSLYIKNFKNLEDFKIESLERVNLITGKNNTGKSTILEALELYSSKGRLKVLIEQLENRGEFDSKSDVSLENVVKAFSSFFTKRKLNYDNRIEIGEVAKGHFGNGIFLNNSLIINMVRFKEELEQNKTDVKKIHQIILEKEDESEDAKIGLNISFNKKSSIINLNRNYKSIQFFEPRNTHYQFINTSCVEGNLNSQLWDKIALTDKEQYVIDALRIIEPKAERIAFVEGTARERLPVIKLKDEKQVLPLKSMGDGINRILTIILALVNSAQGILLVDEFENGLHHTVQEQLWKMIFLLAEELDIQVFATTHSEDCIRGFENVLNDYHIATNGKLIRLDKKGDKIIQVGFNKEELKVATDFDIEIR